MKRKEKVNGLLYSCVEVNEGVRVNAFAALPFLPEIKRADHPRLATFRVAL